MEWGKIAFFIAAAVMAWFIYRSIRHKPELFSGKNLQKSLSTLGVLAIILILFVGALIILLRAS